MTQLYNRRWSFIAGTDNGSGLDLSSLQIQFTVRQWELSTPSNAQIRIFNLSKVTAEKLAKEFTRVVIQAGYEGLFGTIFEGQVIQYRRGRTSPVDTYVDITAADGDPWHNFAVVNQTLAAGSKPEDQLRALITASGTEGVTAGYTEPGKAPALPRGKVLYGMVRDHMRDLGENTGCVWNIRNGKLNVYSRGAYLPNEAVVLTSDTGMIGLPTQTPDGIMVRCLLNPLLQAGGRIKLDNESIQRAARNPAYAGEASYSLIPKVDSDGTYIILAVDHHGDTRGNPWYSEVACQALDVTDASKQSPASLSQLQRGRGG